MPTPENSGQQGDMGKSAREYGMLNDLVVTPEMRAAAPTPVEVPKVDGLVVNRDASGAIVEPPVPRFYYPEDEAKTAGGTAAMSEPTGTSSVDSEQGEPSVFTKNQEVWVQRSDKSIQRMLISTGKVKDGIVMTHGEDAELGLVDRKNNYNELIALQEKLPKVTPKYAEGTQVSVPRTDAPTEYDWKIVSVDVHGNPPEPGKVIAGKIVDGKTVASKPYTPEQLSARQPVFETGQSVQYDTGKGMETWSVFNHNENGMVRLGAPRENSDDNVELKTLSLAELYLMQQPGYEPKKPEVAQATQAEPTNKPSLRQRLGNRIAGK